MCTIEQEIQANGYTKPAPQAAIELIHRQPVRWTHKRIMECDGGGGPLGHPRIFINLDKPEICACTYCGLPYVSFLSVLVIFYDCSSYLLLLGNINSKLQANEHHRKHLESLPSTSYPLVPQGDAAEVPISQRITDEALGQR
jgi:NADH dehydrogenase (ubiquinone) Fe-S protein 6